LLPLQLKKNVVVIEASSVVASFSSWSLSQVAAAAVESSWHQRQSKVVVVR
jgi:hypothetical protein